ncbi:hypothetical protein VTO73DRAFT_11841 [Trametes versicolor]
MRVKLPEDPVDTAGDTGSVGSVVTGVVPKLEPQAEGAVLQKFQLITTATMPDPKDCRAPNFRGKHIHAFVQSLEHLAAACSMELNELPGYVLRYCSREVRNVLVNEDVFRGEDWVAAQERLIHLYESQTSQFKASIRKLRKFSKKQGKKKRVRNRKTLDKYRNKFILLMGDLVKKGECAENEANMMFYQGLPSKLREAILPILREDAKAAGKKLLKRCSPSIETVWNTARDYYSSDDINQLDSDDSDDDSDESTSSSDSGSDSDDSSSGSDSEDTDLFRDRKKKKNKKKSKKSRDDSDDSDSDSDGSARKKGKKKAKGKKSKNDPLMSIEERLVKRMDDFAARLLADRHPTTTVVPIQPSGYGNMPGAPGGFSAAGSAMGWSGDKKCFICGKVEGMGLDHRFGVRSCPETDKLRNEGLLGYSPTDGWMLRPDGRELPRLQTLPNGLASYLHAEQMQAQTASGSWTGRDLPPHQSSSGVRECMSLGLYRDGRPVIDHDEFSLSSYVGAYSMPAVTRAKGKEVERMARIEEVHEDNGTQRKSTTSVTTEKIPVVGTTGREVPVSQHRPHTANTEEGWKAAQKDKYRTRVEDAADDHTPSSSEPSHLRTTSKTTSVRFTSDVQDSVSINAIQNQILDTKLTISLRDVLAMSPHLQKGLGSLVKTRREYEPRTVKSADVCEMSCLEVGVFEEQLAGDATAAAHVTYDRVSEDLNDLLERYADAVTEQQFLPIVLPTPPPLPTHPPPTAAFSPTPRLSLERLNIILGTVPADFLWPAELDLLIHVLSERQAAIAFTDNERGIFSREYFPDYVIPVIEHTPWVRSPILIPKAIEKDIQKLIRESRPWLGILKKNGALRLVHDLQDLNAITIRDSALPPRPDDFAESFVGRAIYGVADLFSGYDARTLHPRSRDLTTFQCMDDSARCTCLPQGAANAVVDFGRCTKHTLLDEPDAAAFVDDCGIKGPTSRYNEEVLSDNPGIRRFVYEYATTFDRVFRRFELAGVTASGTKLVLAAPQVQIVGLVVSLEGWHLCHGVINKVLKWPYPSTLTEVRSFLGIAGVGRRWIKGFSLVAKPLTLLCRSSEDVFVLPRDARDAIDALKDLVSSAPVLKAIDYDAARSIHPPLTPPMDGLVVVGVDSSIYGAGWVLYQYHGSVRHPALFGSCTFTAPESRYSQPKIELYGVFRALKELRTRIWGAHILVEVDAKFLQQMIREPDLPNAPMTRWVSYIQLFDFTLQHVPAEKGKAQDALSRRPSAPDDSEESDGEAHLDEVLGYQGEYALDSSSLIPTSRTVFAAQAHDAMSPSRMSYGRDFNADNTHLHARIHSVTHMGTVPLDDPQARVFALMLRDSLTESVYTGEEVKNTRPLEADFLLGDEVVHLEYWETSYTVLSARERFKAKAARFTILNDRLWRNRRGKSPLLVVTREAYRKQLVAEAHKVVGHRGRDTTYKALSDRYFWPTLYADVAWFVRSCNTCQYHSKKCTLTPLKPTMTPYVCRRMVADTVYMPGSKGFMLHVLCVTGKWDEARASKKNDSRAWAKFLYEDVISRFGCTIVFVCDGGPEFKGAVRELMERYGILIIMSSPYHPEGNGIAERDGQMLSRVVLRLAGDRPHTWPDHLHAALLAKRTTTSRATGYTPYYLIYGMHCLFPFDIADRTWYGLDWHDVVSTEDLLTLRAKQLERRKEDIGIASANVLKTRQRSVDDYMKRNAHRIRHEPYEDGTWVLLHETWLDGQHGNKGALRWAGPYVVDSRHENTYRLRELDGSLLRSHVAGSRLKLFYFRDDLQTLRTFSARVRSTDPWSEQLASPAYEYTCNLIHHSTQRYCREFHFGSQVPPNTPTYADLVDVNRRIDLGYFREDDASDGTATPTKFAVTMKTNIRDLLEPTARCVGDPERSTSLSQGATSAVADFGWGSTRALLEGTDLASFVDDCEISESVSR